jgi:hypothetical protein
MSPKGKLKKASLNSSIRRQTRDSAHRGESGTYGMTR